MALLASSPTSTRESVPCPHVKQADKDLGSNQDDDEVLQEVGLLVLDDLQEVLQVVLDEVKLRAPIIAMSALPGALRLVLTCLVAQKWHATQPCPCAPTVEAINTGRCQTLHAKNLEQHRMLVHSGGPIAHSQAHMLSSPRSTVIPRKTTASSARPLAQIWRPWYSPNALISRFQGIFRDTGWSRISYLSIQRTLTSRSS